MSAVTTSTTRAVRGCARVDLRGLSDAQVDRLAMLDERVDSPYGKAQLRVVFTDEMQRSEQLLNHALHGYLVADAHRSPGFESYKRVAERVRRRHVEDRRALVSDLTTIVRSTPQLVGLRHQACRVEQLRPTEFVVVDQMEHEPDPESRVTIIPRNLDRFGLPRLRLDWRIGASTRRSQLRMHELFRDALARAGITTFRSDVLDQPDAELELWDMKHPSGTTRMQRVAANRCRRCRRPRARLRQPLRRRQLGLPDDWPLQPDPHDRGACGSAGGSSGAPEVRSSRSRCRLPSSSATPS